MECTYKYNSKIGAVFITADENNVLEIKFSSDKTNFSSNPLIKKTIKQLNEYFEGKRIVFDLPLKLQGTEFQQRVWQELQKIRYGEIKTYAEIAEAVGNKKAARAVGNANNKNNIAIVIPCHRVIGCNGSLTGYSGGTEIKKKLLDLESKCKIKSV